MKKPNRLVLAACGLGIAASLIGVGTANADPTAPPANAFDRPLQGEGSDTTEEVMNGLSEVVVDGSGNKLFASWNAKSSSGFTTRSAANTPAGSNCVYSGNPTPNSAYLEGARANGSTNGQKALRDAFQNSGGAQVTFGCLDFARSSSAASAANLGTVAVAQIPLASDSLTFALTRTSVIPRQLTAQALKDAYHCIGGGFANNTWKAVIPQAGSGTRSSWLSKVGLTEAELAPAGSLPCVTDQADLGARGGPNPLNEHDARSLNNTAIVPFSTAQWIAMMGGAVSDLRGSSMLGTIKNTATSAELSYPVSLNPGYGDLVGTADDLILGRTVYNLVPQKTLTGGATPNATSILVFEDTDSGAANTSLICAQSAVLRKFGLAPISTCGNTSTIVNPQP